MPSAHTNNVCLHHGDPDIKDQFLWQDVTDQ
jgi:hypothetical protein